MPFCYWDVIRTFKKSVENMIAISSSDMMQESIDKKNLWYNAYLLIEECLHLIYLNITTSDYWCEICIE